MSHQISRSERAVLTRLHESECKLYLNGDTGSVYIQPSDSPKTSVVRFATLRGLLERGLVVECRVAQQPLRLRVYMLSRRGQLLVSSQ